jgi:hypothetical protein
VPYRRSKCHGGRCNRCERRRLGCVAVSLTLRARFVRLAFVRAVLGESQQKQRVGRVRQRHDSSPLTRGHCSSGGCAPSGLIVTMAGEMSAELYVRGISGVRGTCRA